MNKRFLQFIAAFLILIFHLWIPVTGAAWENYIIKLGYIGVDLFFFLSAYSLADKKLAYGSFLWNRFTTIYIKYLLLVIVAAIYKSFTILRVVKQLTLVEFFEKGGGGFLWFVPAIIIFYLLYPLFLRWNFRYKVILVLVAWFVLSLLLEITTGYNKIFIFTNRIPVILAGYILKKRPLSKWIMLICLPIGLVLLYFFGYKYRLQTPFTDIYFVIGLVAVLGLCGISYFIKDATIWNILGMGTLELYGLQMIFGPDLAMQTYKFTGNALTTNLIVIVVLFAVSIAIAVLYAFIIKRLKVKKA